MPLLNHVRPESARLSAVNCFGRFTRIQASYVKHRFEWHIHADEYVLAFVRDGAEAFRCRGENHVAVGGTLLIHNPGEPHDGHSAVEGGWTVETLYPPPHVIEEALGRPPPLFRDLMCREPMVLRYFSVLHALLDMREPPLVIESAFLKAITSLAEADGASTCVARHAVQRKRLDNAYALIDSQFGEPLTLAMLAQAAGLHPNYLWAAFRECYGVTPARLLCYRRLAAARALIRDGMKLSEVSVHVGFYDQAHFTRRFKGAYGVTPAQYRALHRGKGRRA